ncbi:MAG: hypothetical protein M3N54_12055 [Acidobacteriota bacterium]|nr:hypothetical protein [Acidobacteriota bacterium]
MALAQQTPPPAQRLTNAAAAPLHLIPPPGVTVPEADQRQLRSGLDRLAKRMEALKMHPHIADVEIFHNAVRYALEGNEFPGGGFVETMDFTGQARAGVKLNWFEDRPPT